jgi:geranylgeranyl diphosphate synthase type II
MNNYIESISTNIEIHLKKYFKENDPMIEICKYSMKHGKKIRPSISLDICKSLLNSTENVEFPSLLVEYLHTASLIIDDLPCMDNATIRRNNPTTHIKFGEAVTQLSSVVFLSLAMDALNLGLNSDQSKKEEMIRIGFLVFSKLSKILGSDGVAGGQLLDLAMSNKDIKDMYKEKIDLNEMIVKKTGALFELSFLIGWLFGKGDTEKIEDVREISLHFSMIYQILDDLEDVEEDSNTTEISKNYVITHGKEASIKNCNMFINKFKMGMIKLNIYSDYFKELMKYVKEKLEKYM